MAGWLRRLYVGRDCYRYKVYKFGTTDLNFTLCLNKEYDDLGQQKGDCFVVESLRDEDCFSKSRTAYTVTHIFSAPNDAKKYTTLLFLDKKCNDRQSSG